MKSHTEMAVQTLENRMNQANKVVQKAEKVISQFEQMEAQLNVTKAHNNQLQRKLKLSQQREKLLVYTLILISVCWFIYSMS